MGDDFAAKLVPPHVNLFFCFGGIVFTAFFAQFASGGLLSITFRPSVVEAGLLGVARPARALRAAHRVSSNALILALALHVARVFTSGAHLRPRELTWLSGALLALTASAAGVTGYALPWDQLGYWAFCIVSAMPAALDAYVAGRGAALVALLRGGPTLAQAGLSRCFFAPEVVVVPVFAHAAKLFVKVTFFQQPPSEASRLKPRISTGERPFIDVLQDRRFWLIHSLTVPSLAGGGAALVLLGVAPSESTAFGALLSDRFA